MQKQFWKKNPHLLDEVECFDPFINELIDKYKINEQN